MRKFQVLLEKVMALVAGPFTKLLTIKAAAAAATFSSLQQMLREMEALFGKEM